MTYDQGAWQFDCEPTLDDDQVIQFCRDGYLTFPGVVDAEVNQRACEWLDGSATAEPSFVPAGMSQADLERIRATHEPSTILLENWFIRGVLLESAVAGAVRSLLGAGVGLPVLVSDHSVDCPAPAGEWHYDADAVFGPELRFVEAFYFPQDTPPELGPTEVLTSSHYERRRADPEGDGTAVTSAGPAGTIVVHHQTIQHRKGASAAAGRRRMLKYSYWRSAPPQRDWIQRADFDPRRADYGVHSVARYAAHIYAWLCGRGDDYRLVGGQGWPAYDIDQAGPAYGYASAGGYVPDWRKDNDDDYAQPTRVGDYR